MSERMDKALAALERVLHGTGAGAGAGDAQAPNPSYPENYQWTSAPPAADDWYLQPSGGLGSRRADAIEAERQRQLEQKLAAEREARESQIRHDPQAQRVIELKRRTIELERRLAELESPGEET